MGLRQEVSKSQALLLIAASIAYGAARVAAGPLSAPQFVLVLLVLEFVAQPFSTLLHECGHAVAARRVSSGRVSLIVGRGPYLSGTVAGVRVNFSLLPARGVRIRGVCRYEADDVSWRDRAAVSLAGPLATMLELLVAAIVTLRLWSGTGPLVRNLLVLVLIGLAMSLLANLVPNTIVPGVLSNDGANALRAIRNQRAGVPPATRPTGAKAVTSLPLRNGPRTSSTGPTTPTPSKLANTQPLTTMHEQDRDRARAATSVPPPGPPS